MRPASSARPRRSGSAEEEQKRREEEEKQRREAEEKARREAEEKAKQEAEAKAAAEAAAAQQAAGDQPQPVPDPAVQQPAQAQAPADGRGEGGFMSTQVSAAQVKALRDRTQAGVMDAKSALAEADGDMDKAVEILRVKGQASAAKRADRGTAEGVVASYIHANERIGAMVEVQCETDFVARNEDFQAFAYEVALHVAAADPSVRLPRGHPRGRAPRSSGRSHEQKAREEGKPDEIVEKIVEGQLAKWAKDVALLEQEHVNADKHDGKTIEELRAGSRREDRREHPHRPLRTIPGGRGVAG